MELKDFIGKVVVSTKNKERYVLTEITAPKIVVRTEKQNGLGYRPCYGWETINGDPITNGYLIFEDQSLTEPFKEAYNKHCNTQDAYWETYGYYMSKD